MDQSKLLLILEPLSNEEAANKMKKYMRNQFEYLGIAAPVRRDVFKSFFQENASIKEIDREFIRACWESDYRELQYAAIDYLYYVSKLLSSDDLLLIKELIVKKSWWDTIDSMSKLVGQMIQADATLKVTMLAWSMDDNLWVRRMAIIHQLQFKTNMDTALLASIILNNVDHTDFFIRKAIGWILRDYSKTDANWVREFINMHQSQLSALSMREGSKYI